MLANTTEARSIESGKARPASDHRNRAVKILAKSIYRELSSQGYDDKQIVALATELIGAVTQGMSGES